AEGDPEAQVLLSALLGPLTQLGWTEGRNLRIDYRWAVGDVERMRTLARELIALQPDMIVANTTPVTGALYQETRTVPIVFVIVSDPVGAGFVASLARPGGNFTGFINVEGSFGGKWLDLLRDIAPQVRRVAMMFNPNTAPAGGTYFLPSFEAASRAHGVEPIAAPVRERADIERVMASLGNEGRSGLVVQADGFLLVNRATIISLAARYNIPAIYPVRIWARDGGLLTYGADNRDMFRRAAPYVDRILRGAKPSDLPVEVPTKFELVINLKTAKTLGLTPSLTLQAIADEVIE